MDADAHVCPDCGESAGGRPFCASCGRNLTLVERLPTRAAWEQSLRDLVQSDDPSAVEPAPAPSDPRPGSPEYGGVPMWTGRPMAHWGYRVGAFIFDLGLVVTIALLAGYALDSGGADSDVTTAVIGLGLIVVWPLSQAITMGITGGQTLGKSIAGIRVLREDGGPAGFGKGFVREVLCRLIYLVPFVFLIDGLLPLGKQRRSIRDRMAKTGVVQEPVYARRAWPIALAAVLACVGWTIGSLLNGGFDSDKRDFIAGCEDEGVSEGTCECAWTEFQKRVSAERLDEIRFDDALPADVERASVAAFEACP